MSQTGKDYIGYEYKEITVNTDQVSMYLDCYENFGWHADDKIPITNGMNQTTIKLKRDRKIINKMELTRLQRNFEACAREIELLQRRHLLPCGLLRPVFLVQYLWRVRFLQLLTIRALSGCVCYLQYLD